MIFERLEEDLRVDPYYNTPHETVLKLIAVARAAKKSSNNSYQWNVDLEKALAALGESCK